MGAVHENFYENCRDLSDSELAADCVVACDDRFFAVNFARDRVRRTVDINRRLAQNHQVDPYRGR